jgi:hypothetical protein
MGGHRQLEPRRAVFTLTALPSGQVLAAGGNDGTSPGGYAATAELYNPATGTWTTTSNTSRTGNYAAALLPNGPVLTIGGGTLANGAELYTL